MKTDEQEQRINNVLAFQDKELKEISTPDTERLEERITESEELLHSLGYSTESIAQMKGIEKKETIIVPSWDALCEEAERVVGNDCELESLFTEEELLANKEAVALINNDFNQVYRLDKFDYIICATAALLSGLADILLVGIPAPSKEGVSAGPLSDYIRKRFEKKYPPEEMGKLGGTKKAKTPYDAQDNRNTSVDVDGLSAYYHRLLSLGHDPLLGFIVGVLDIIRGTMTTIDKSGRIVTQVIENYADRQEPNLFKAIAKQILHLKSDLTTSMGLPAPLMGLFNLLQFGSIGEEEQTIAEIVQGMYYEGYDFIHFCSMSIPVMITEVIIRVGYAIKRIKEGNKIKDSIPLSLNRDKHPKLATMLFIGHSGATAINLGKVAFTQNPMAINHPQWLAFAKYSYKQLKWVLIQKPMLSDNYVNGKIELLLNEVYSEIDDTLSDYSDRFNIVFD